MSGQFTPMLGCDRGEVLVEGGKTDLSVIHEANEIACFDWAGFRVIRQKSSS